MSTTVGVAIRDANLGDAPVLAQLMCELGYPTSEPEMKERMQTISTDTNLRTLVAVIDGEVCGMIGTLIVPSHEHNDLTGGIVALVVSPARRRKGVARRLVERAEEDFSRRNIRRVTLTTRLTRKNAHKFYEDLGYEQTGYRYAKNLGDRS
jgi:ribosomal protein S18 acetylase RimI-like enzyme